MTSIHRATAPPLAILLIPVHTEHLAAFTPSGPSIHLRLGRRRVFISPGGPEHPPVPVFLPLAFYISHGHFFEAPASSCGMSPNM